MSFGISGPNAASTQPATNPTDTSAALNIPANLNLTSDQQSQIQGILQQLENGSITPQQARDQITALLSPQQQQTLQADAAKAHQHHHHHQGGSPAASPDDSGGQDLGSILNLSTDQQSQITQILQNAQTNGTPAAGVLQQIEGVLTPSQQQQLNQLFSWTYSSSGTQQAQQPPIINTTA